MAHMLTSQQKEVLTNIALGYSMKRTGRLMYLSENTIKGHMKLIIHNLKAQNGVHAVVIAMKLGLINP